MTGAIGEARILFTDTEDVKAGARATMTIAAGQSLGLFLVPDIEEIGIELEDFEEGGLFFRNFAAGDVADLYDGDDATTYTPGPATIFDGIAPVVTDDEGNLLPIRAFHSVGNRDGSISSTRLPERTRARLPMERRGSTSSPSRTGSLAFPTRTMTREATTATSTTPSWP